jgi:hypothetical protein
LEENFNELGNFGGEESFADVFIHQEGIIAGEEPQNGAIVGVNGVNGVGIN